MTATLYMKLNTCLHPKLQQQNLLFRTHCTMFSVTTTGIRANALSWNCGMWNASLSCTCLWNEHRCLIVLDEALLQSRIIKGTWMMLDSSITRQGKNMSFVKRMVSTALRCLFPDFSFEKSQPNTTSLLQKFIIEKILKQRFIERSPCPILCMHAKTVPADESI